VSPLKAAQPNLMGSRLKYRRKHHQINQSSGTNREIKAKMMNPNASPRIASRHLESPRVAMPSSATKPEWDSPQIDSQTSSNRSKTRNKSRDGSRNDEP
jgi:hypothetical protein